MRVKRSKKRNLNLGWVAITVMAVVFAAPAISEAETFNFILSWGTYGMGDGEFNAPRGITVDSSGYVYVTDTWNNRIQKFDSDGTFLAKWGSYGSGDGQFDCPYGIAADSFDSVYVAEYRNHRIQKFDSDGTFLTKWGSYGSCDGQFNYPFDIEADSSGDVYVTDQINHRIQKFDSDGTFLAKWGSYGSGDGQFNCPFGIAVDSSGNIYVVDYNDHRIQKFSTVSPTPETMLSRTAQFIIDEIETGNIDAELETSLLAKIGAALEALERGNPNDAKVAMNDLKALINQVEAQTDKKITAEAAAEIIRLANEIITALEGL